MASFLGFDPPSNLRVGGSNPSRRASIFLAESATCREWVSTSERSEGLPCSQCYSWGKNGGQGGVLPLVPVTRSSEYASSQAGMLRDFKACAFWRTTEFII